MEVSQNSQAASLYFNMIYREELEKRQAFLTKRQYLNFLKVLVEVHEESGVAHPNGLPWYRNGYEIHKFTSLNPPSTVYDLIVRIQTLCINLLFAAEAASRIKELRGCVKFFLKEWRKENFFPVPTKKIDLFLKDDPLFITADRVIEDIQYKSSKIPQLWLPELSKYTLLEMQAHLTGLEILIFREALNKSLSEEEILAFFKKSEKAQDVSFAVMLHRYVRHWTTFSFKKNQMQEVTDPCVYLCLMFMDDLQTLDLSECKSLTIRCLQDGHPTLQALILTETSIDPKDIDYAKFPELKMVLKDIHYPNPNPDAGRKRTDKKNRSCSPCLII